MASSQFMLSLNRLRDDIRRSRRRMDKYRQTRIEAIHEFVGRRYSDETTAARRPINLVEMTHQVLLRNLVSSCPKIHVSTMHPQLKPSARKLQVATNYLLEHRLKMHKVLREVVSDALFGMGIVKHGICDYAEGHENRDIGSGQPFCDRVSLDDWVHDMSVKSFREVSYMGSRFSMRLHEAKNTEYFDEKVRTMLAESSYRESDIDYNASDRASDLTAANQDLEHDWIRKVHLWDIYLPREQIVVTISDQLHQEPLRVIEWAGPKEGPYKILSFEDVPDNTLPLPPVHMWLDMHELSNKIFNKMSQQAVRSKTVLVGPADARKDMETIRDAGDGDVILSNSADRMREVHFGGTDQMLQSFFLGIRGQHSYQNGNLDAMGGLAAQSETFKQDKLISESASQKLSEMQDRTEEFTAECCEAMAFYLWEDPHIDLPLVDRDEATGVEFPVRYTPSMRQGEFLDYNFQIKTHSLRRKTPSEKIQVINQTMQMLGPWMPYMQQQGIMPNFQKYIEQIAEATDTNELHDILQSGFIPQIQPVGEAPSKMSQGGERRYISEGRSGMTQQGADRVMMNTLAGGKMQGQEQQNAMSALGG